MKDGGIMRGTAWMARERANTLKCQLTNYNKSVQKRNIRTRFRPNKNMATNSE
jgi:hypothetical protein